MAFPNRLGVVERGTDGGELGLGPLLGIALGGGALVFGTIGLLLAWYIRRRNKRQGQDGGVYGGTNGDSWMPSSTKLVKKRLLLGGSETMSGLSSRISSRFSMSTPPVLPPLSISHSLSVFGTVKGRKRSKSWVDEDELHGPKVSKVARDTWFSRDSWFGLKPTLPNVGMEVGGDRNGLLGLGREEVVLTQRQIFDLEKQDLAILEAEEDYHSRKTRMIPGTVLSSTPDELRKETFIQASETKFNYASETGHSPVKSRPSLRLQSPVKQPQPPQLPHQQHRLSQTSPLKVHTPIRLEHTSSYDYPQVSPTRTHFTTPGSSPVRGSRTPRSHRAMSSISSAHGIRMTPSPSKKAGLHQGTPQSMISHGSVASIGSAANSLIAAATHELELPGGCGSPSRARASIQWEHQAADLARLQTSFDNTKIPLSPPKKSPLRQSPQGQSPQRNSPPKSSPQKNSPHRYSPQRLSQQPQPPPQIPVPQLPISHIHQMAQSQVPPVQYSQPPQQGSLSHAGPRKQDHRRSRDSDVSSTLSTLYSVNEPEEKKPASEEDPFVDRNHRRMPSWQSRRKPVIFNTLQRPKPKGPVPYPGSRSAAPSPLRPVSLANEDAEVDMDVDGEFTGPVIPFFLQPPTRDNSADLKAVASGQRNVSGGSLATSEASFVSMSVQSDESDETEKPAHGSNDREWRDRIRAGSEYSEPTTVSARASEISSPYDEQEMMSLLMATDMPRRTLTGRSVTDGNLMSTALAPRPKSTVRAGPRRVSTSSSIYTIESFMGDPRATLTGSPARRATLLSVFDGPAVGNTIHELRRMNSLVSSYSVSSVTSTVMPDGDSPTLPRVFSGGLTKSRSMVVSSSANSISSRHYLTVGRGGELGASTSSLVGSTQRYSAASQARRRSSTLFAPDTQGSGSGVWQRSRNNSVTSGMRISRITDTTSAPSTVANTPSAHRRAGSGGGRSDMTARAVRSQALLEQRLDFVHQVDNQDGRQSVQTLGLYNVGRP